MRIYFNRQERALLAEALDVLTQQNENNHPLQDRIKMVERKLLDAHLKDQELKGVKHHEKKDCINKTQ